jgi:hypothetical protein
LFIALILSFLFLGCPFPGGWFILKLPAGWLSLGDSFEQFLVGIVHRQLLHHVLILSQLFRGAV